MLKVLGVVWIYEREHDELRCEVRPTERGFVLVISRTDVPEQLEQFRTAGGVIARQGALERRLREEGWQLKDFFPSLHSRQSKR